MQARAAMQPMYCPGMKQGKCIDAKRPAFAYMAHYIVRAMYKAWPTTSSWVTMPYFQLQEKFSQGCRYDVLGNWPGKLCEVDPETKVSRDVTDEEILEFARAKADPEDPEGVYLLRRFRANQILSTMILSDQETREMHYSCLFILSDIIPKPTGYATFSLIRPSPNGPTEFLYIDPVGIVLTQSIKDTSADTIALLIDHNIQVPARFTDRVTRRKVDKEKNPQAHVARPALQRILPSDYLTAGQTSIMNQGITQEQRERVARSSNVKGQASASSQEDNRRVTWNANTYVDTGKGKSKTPEEREQERGRLRRWEHDNC